jgi:hypothetical protein
MLHKLKDADLDHPDYKAAGEAVVSTPKDGHYCHPEVLRGVN